MALSRPEESAETIQNEIQGTDGFDLGAFTAFSLYLGIIQGPLRALGFLLPLMQRGEICLTRIYEIRDAAAEAVKQDDSRQVTEEEQFTADSKEIIRIEKLNFSYDSQDDQFCLKIDEFQCSL